MTLRNGILFGATLLSGFVFGWYASPIMGAASIVSVQAVRVNDPDYTFISPLVGLNTPSISTFSDLNNVKNDVQKVIDKEEAMGLVQDVGVNFRLPDNSHTFGINDDDTFDPGSLIKVPIMIAYLREAQSDPSVLSKKLYYQAQPTEGVPNPLEPQLTLNKYYTVDELIKAMIVDSDNVAKDLLISSVDETYLDDVFNEMDMGYLKSTTGTISPRGYVKFFSRLYSATFLDRNYSNYALKLLSETTFHDGLVAGLPDSLVVAHKYGERGIYEDDKLAGIELHDCGIVYVPNKPYYLCVMTKGSDDTAVTRTIKEISATVYADRESFGNK